MCFLGSGDDAIHDLAGTAITSSRYNWRKGILRCLIRKLDAMLKEIHEQPKAIRDTIREIGYTDSSMGFDYETCAVLTAIEKQSPDISRGVDRGANDRHVSAARKQKDRDNNFIGSSLGSA